MAPLWKDYPILRRLPLLGQARDVLRRKHYRTRAEAAYLGWIKCYILFHRKRQPGLRGEAEVENLAYASFPTEM
jgi:hypothetical protein